MQRAHESEGGLCWGTLERAHSLLGMRRCAMGWTLQLPTVLSGLMRGLDMRSPCDLWAHQ